MKRAGLLSALVVSLLAQGAVPERLLSHATNHAAEIRFLGLQPYLDATDTRHTKIAILGHRFAGALSGDGSPQDGYLPKTAEFSLGNDDSAEFSIDATDDTDRKLAQAIWAMLDYSEDDAPKFRLFNARGPVNFRSAVQAAIEWGADVIYNTETIPGFGNGDGTGPIHALLQKAALADILWIQDAKRYRDHVYRVPVSCVKGQVVFPGNQNSATFYLLSDNQKVRIDLSYNRWGVSTNITGTADDLDLTLLDGPNGAVLAQSQTKQRLETTAGDNDRELLPLESVEATLGKRDEKSPYHIVVKCKGTFDAARDTLQLVVTTNRPPTLDEAGQEKSPLQALRTSESSLVVPQDSLPGVAVMVGDLTRYSTRGAVFTLAGRRIAKPEITLEPGSLSFSDDTAVSGPDLAGARIAALAVLLRAHSPTFGPKHFYAFARKHMNSTQLETDLRDGLRNARSTSQLFVPPAPKDFATWLRDNQ